MSLLKILFLEPFYGGSHKAVADGFARCSRHRVDIFIPCAQILEVAYARQCPVICPAGERFQHYDLVLATDMVDVTDFKALAGPECPPVALYFHENQLSYPLEPGEKRDFHLGFTNIIRRWLPTVYSLIHNSIKLIFSARQNA